MNQLLQNIKKLRMNYQRQAEKVSQVGSNSPLYSDTKNVKIF